MKEALINQIIQRRDLMGISKRDMAKRLGVSYFGYRRLENSENVGIDMFIKTCEELGLEINIKIK